MKMKAKERRDWIIDYIRKNGPVDILKRDFVDAYVEATGASYLPANYGSNKCQRLYEDLVALHEEYSLKRVSVGIKGMAGQGFPNWVYSYSLAVEFA